MLHKLSKEKMPLSNLGWLESRFHFSFAHYRNPENMNFGVLRVLNDDIVHPNSGFAMHPHEDMEIITYVVDGEITHKDSMGNEEVLRRGEVQYISAGKGIMHSEYNESGSLYLRLLQIWILPPAHGLETLYGSHRFEKEERYDKLLKIVSSQKGDAKIKLYQDADIYVSELPLDHELAHKIEQKRQIYYVQIEGTCTINGVRLDQGDALEIVDENALEIKALTASHFLFIEMPHAL